MESAAWVQIQDVVDPHLHVYIIIDPHKQKEN